ENTGAAAVTLSVNLNSLTQGFGGVIRDGTGGGALSLVKAGTGTLVLTGANAYTGPTTAQAGVLQFNSAASVGGSGASVAVLFGATAADVGLNGTSGGTVILTGANTHTGGTIIGTGAVLQVNADAAFGAASTGITFTGGTLRLGSASALGGARPITLFAGGGAIDTNG